MENTIFTIGHSTHSLDRFISLLQQHRITALCDVRSKPYSRLNSHFNRERLKEVLNARSIKYVFLGRELGGRSEDPACYENGKVRYQLVARSRLFDEGLERIKRGVNHYRLAIMCAEKDPLECHRSILVARHLTSLGFHMEHILADGGLESHERAMMRLSRLFNLNEDDMFRSREDVWAELYQRQEERIAYDSNSTTSIKPVASKTQ